MSSSGARPKEHAKRNLSVDNSSFYADLVLIYSKDDCEEASEFLLEIQHVTEKHSYVVTGYLDNRLTKNGQPDFERCSAFMFLFTKKSVQEYSKLTSHKGLQNLVYDGKMIPVLAEDGLVLPMSAKVSHRLRYTKHRPADWTDSLLAFLRKNARKRCTFSPRTEEERNHKEKENDVPHSTSEQNVSINITADYVICGDGGKIEINHPSKQVCRECRRDCLNISCSEEERLESEEGDQNVPSSNPKAGVTRPTASASSPPPQNQQNSPDVLFRNGSIPDQDCCSDTNDDKQTLSRGPEHGPSLRNPNKNPVPVRLLEENLTFQNISIESFNKNSTRNQAAVDTREMSTCTFPSSTHVHPCPKEISCGMFSFSGFSREESNIPVASHQTDGVNNEDSLFLPPVESLNLNSILNE